MTQADDRLLQALANLPLFTPDTEWEKRVRLRCHTKIAGPTSARAQARRQTSLGTRLSDAVTVAALFAYMAEMLGETARLVGLLWTAR